MNSRKKILYVHSNLGVGGAEELRLTLLGELKKQRTDCFDILVCSLESKGEIGREIEKLGFNVISLNVSHSIFNPLTTLKLAKLVKEFRPEIVQCSMFNAGIHGAIALLLINSKARLFWEVHGTEDFKKRYHIILESILAHRVEKIIGCSNYVCEHMRKKGWIPKAKFLPIHNVLNVDRLKKRFSNINNQDETIIEGYYPIIGVVGRFHKNKGQIYALKSLAGILRSYPKAMLILLGAGPEEEALRSYVKKNSLGRSVRFMGLKRDIAKYYAILDILVVPSISEGFGIVLLEAMYSFVPCVASHVGGIPEVITHEKNGLLVEARSSDAIAKSVVRLLEDKEFYLKLVNFARIDCIKRFLPPRYIKELKNLYNQA